MNITSIKRELMVGGYELYVELWSIKKKRG